MCKLVHVLETTNLAGKLIGIRNPSACSHVSTSQIISKYCNMAVISHWHQLINQSINQSVAYLPM